MQCIVLCVAVNVAEYDAVVCVAVRVAVCFTGCCCFFVAGVAGCGTGCGAGCAAGVLQGVLQGV